MLLYKKKVKEIFMYNIYILDDANVGMRIIWEISAFKFMAYV